MSSIRLKKRPAFCTFHSPFLITSTYQLDSDSNSRSGSLHFFNPDLSSNQPAIATPAGVFRFQIVDDYCISALTDGSLHFVNLSDFSMSNVKVTEDMLLNVSIFEDKAAVTTNKGSIFVLEYPSGKVISNWIGHKLPYSTDPCEVWSVALSDNNLCTGAEDALLNFWDLRTFSKTGCSKVFDAGVTFINWIDDNLLLTGSYDQNIRVLDNRNLREPVIEKKTAGGVWHIETKIVDGKKLHLAACMYGGFALLDENWEILYNNEDAGKELLYGVTFLEPSTVACTTFNDFHVSIYKIPLL